MIVYMYVCIYMIVYVRACEGIVLPLGGWRNDISS